MRRKSTKVKVARMHPDIWPDLFRLDEAWRRWTDMELLITSARDGTHSDTSDHYWGGAIDIRTWRDPAGKKGQISGNKRKQLLSKTKRLLGRNWYVLDEGTHFHLSWRPRGPE